MNKTSIEWTDFSANPIKYRDANGRVVWACVHASPGCQHCYAETLAHRYGKGGPFNVPTTAAVTPFLDERELHRMLTYKPASGKRCFVGDMTDVFGPWVPDELLDRLFAVFALRQDVIWQVLTKRAERMREYCRTLGKHHEVDRVSLAAKRLNEEHGFFYTLGNNGWHIPNVWLGVSAEDQERADERIPLLLQTPAAVRFVSAEPLLGPIDLDHIRYASIANAYVPALSADRRIGCTVVNQDDRAASVTFPRLSWVIVGGESGPGARPCDVGWVRAIVSQCRAAEVPVFVKQLGAKVRQCGDGREPLVWSLNDRKGGDISEWPQDVRVREFPA